MFLKQKEKDPEGRGGKGGGRSEGERMWKGRGGRRETGGDRRGKGSGEGGREVREGGSIVKGIRFHMNRGWAYTELILKELFKGEKPTCAHF